MKYQTIITDLSSFGERQFEVEIKARQYIETILKENNIGYKVQEYQTQIPKYIDFSLTADGKEVTCRPSGFVSGKITNTDSLISSLISSQKNFYDPNINFNPRCEYISRSNHYGAPALSVNRSDVQTLINAKEIKGVLEVQNTAHTSANILVGNTDDPESLIVSHYDSIENGAVDNASGIALSLQLILEQPKLLTKNLFILCGNEELSYDETVYWGHGYREFENEYENIIRDVKKIIILDSFGFSKTETITDSSVIKLAFPIKGLKEVIRKTVLIAGSYKQLMAFYHAENDTPEKITEKYFNEAKRLVWDLLQK